METKTLDQLTNDELLAYGEDWQADNAHESILCNIVNELKRRLRIEIGEHNRYAAKFQHETLMRSDLAQRISAELERPTEGGPA